MKKFTLYGVLALALITGVVIAADHLDAPAVANTTSDIADFYAFEGEAATSTTFVVTVPAENTASNFDENVMFEINIDNTGVQNGGVVEDLVIQCLRQGNEMFFFGPYTPVSTGLTNTIDPNALVGSVSIGAEQGGRLDNGIRAFAGHRRDAFFFDFQAFNTVVGTAPIEGFGSTGTNSFADANVNAIVLEVPNALLGTPPDHIVDQLLGRAAVLPSAYNVWVTSNRR
jgi:hypothetical protein